MLGLTIPLIFTRVVTLVIALSIHEFSHAWVANALGDDTPRLNGRLTLNPLAHLDLIGSLMLLVAGFGWARPVPVNPYNFRSKSAGMMWVGLAGPLSNLLLAILASIPFRLGLDLSWPVYSRFFPSLSEFLYTFIIINLVLMLFNLIPIAPLDGEKILSHFLPPSLGDIFEHLRPYGPLLLMLVFFAAPALGFPILNWILSPALSGITHLLLGGV